MRAKPHGPLDEWLYRHIGRQIPRSYAIIGEAAGVSANAVKCYMYRRRRTIQQDLAKLPDLRKLPIQLVNEDHVVRQAEELSTYNYHIDRFSMHVYIVGKVNGQTEIFPIESLKEFIKAVAKGG